MTVREKLESILLVSGLSQERIDEVMPLCIAEIERRAGSKIDSVWKSPARDYGETFFKLWFHAMKPIVLNYIDEKCPGAWFRPAFSNGADYNTDDGCAPGLEERAHAHMEMMIDADESDIVRCDVTEDGVCIQHEQNYCPADQCGINQFVRKEKRLCPYCGASDNHCTDIEAETCSNYPNG